MIENKKFFGFADHDYKEIVTLSVEGKIKWFEYRFNKIIIRPIEDIMKIVAKEQKKPQGAKLLEDEDVSIFTIVVLAICVGIDLLGGFLDGTKGDTNRKTFKNFVTQFLDPQKEYLKTPYEGAHTYATFLYMKFRCGLAHNLTIKEVGFTYGEKYFVKGDGFYYVSVDRLFKDLKRGLEQYLSELSRNKSNLKRNFNDRFEHIFIRKK